MKVFDHIHKYIALKRKTEVPRKTELETLTQHLDAMTERLEKLEIDLTKAVSGYRLLLIKENPEILPELIHGESIAALDRSLETAQTLTAKIREQMAAKAVAERVPGGAPVRTPPDIESLDSHGKIIFGLKGQ